MSPTAKRVEPPKEPAPRPSPLLFAFAACFLGGMFYNMWTGGSDYLSIFLGTSALVLLGVDVGKLAGRK